MKVVFVEPHNFLFVFYLKISFSICKYPYMMEQYECMCVCVRVFFAIAE